MIPVIESTKTEKLEIDFAGVDSGTKMFVEDEVAAAAVITHEKKNASI